MQETMIDRYGASSSLTSDTIKSQIFDTNVKRYGNSIFSISHISIEKYQLLNNKDWLIEQNKTKSVDEIRAELGVGQTVVNQRFREFGIIPTKFNSSSLEKSVILFLKDNNIDFICHNRDILGGKELDIFIPEIKLAIECNGTYWHSDLNGKDRNYHLEKTLKSKKSGVDLFHLWEHEWTHKSDIIKSMMLSRLNKLNKIHARKCDLRYVSSKDSKIFLNDNHLQGYCASETCVGLYNNNILVSLMSFRDNRFTSGKELLRFCNVKGTHVVGAASKLFSYFIKKYDVTSIISYSHKDKFTGDMYKRLGFKLKHVSPPAYYYTKDYENVENRMKYQKHKLQKLLPIFESSKTEWENMQNNGYDRIWDCGNDVWEFKKEDIQC
jgi:G:T-mismatch repair DNA endonuclease (very short patch repair protein)